MTKAVSNVNSVEYNDDQYSVEDTAEDDEYSDEDRDVEDRDEYSVKDSDAYSWEAGSNVDEDSVEDSDEYIWEAGRMLMRTEMRTVMSTVERQEAM
jgi:hypothetical protein